MAEQPETRLIILASAPLTEGFGLIGFETFADATVETLDGLLAELIKSRQKALILVEDYLSRSHSTLLNHVRTEGGRILVVEIPRLDAPDQYHPQVEEMVLSILGPTALEERP